MILIIITGFVIKYFVDDWVPPAKPSLGQSHMTSNSSKSSDNN